MRTWKKAVSVTLAVCMLTGLGGCSFDFQKENGEAATEVLSDVEEESKERADKGEKEDVTPEGTVVSGGATDTGTDLTGDEMQEPEERMKVKGIYVSGPVAGSYLMDELITLIDETELNTMVIDVKSDEGYITFDMNLEQVKKMDACISYIPDIDALMKKLKEHGIYTIARIVCFKDPYLAEYEPELALKKPDGTPITDAYGLAWVNPYKEGVWEYINDVAVAASDAGFDEIQFDYVRFPIGSDADEADYGVDRENYTRSQGLTDFFEYTSERLHSESIVFGADLFGTVIGNPTDMEQTGQDYAKLAQMADVLSPMIYPSHYGPGVFNLDVPDAYPYETIYGALEMSNEELKDIPQDSRGVVRPWLQCFTASWIEGHIEYGTKQIKKQIQAVYDTGHEEWILWNSSCRYPKRAFVVKETVMQ